MSNRYYYRPALFIEIDIDVLVTRLDFTEEEYNDILDAKALICLLLFEEQNYP